MGRREGSHELRQIPLQVNAKSEEVGDNDDPFDATSRQSGHGAGQVRLTQLEECRLDVGEPARARQSRGESTDAVVGRFNARTVGKDDEAGAHSIRLTRRPQGRRRSAHPFKRCLFA